MVEVQVSADSDPLKDCPCSWVPVPRLVLAAATEWRRRIGPELTQWLTAYPLHENFLQPPPRQHHAPRNRVDMNNALEVAWVDREFLRLLSIGAVEKWASRPLRLHPIRTAPKKGPKLFRLVINMRSTNRYLRYVTGRYEDIRTVLSLLQRGSWFVTVDMTDAYFMVHFHPNSRTYLGFQWRGCFYVWRVLPFGCSDSSGVFTSLISALVDYWRSCGLLCCSFFDDVFSCAPTKDSCSASLAFIRSEAAALGITWDPKKGNPLPTQRGVVLGFHIDTTSLLLSIPAESLAKITKKAEEMLESGHATLRQLYSLASSLMAFKRASLLAPTRAYSVFAACRGADRWDQQLKVSPSLRLELEWVRSSLPRLASRRFGWEPQEIVAFTTDASLVGCSMVQVDPVTRQPLGPEMRTAFSAEEKELSSNNRELRTLPRGVRSLAHLIRGKVVQFFSDNTTAIAYAAKGGGPVEELRWLARELLELLVSLDADLLPPVHIPGLINTHADLGSRNVETEDYTLRPTRFMKLNKRWGPLSCDRFADDFSTQLPLFNSRWACPGSAAVDAFSQTWSGNEFLFPPLSRLADVAAKILLDRSQGVLVAPSHCPLLAALEPFVVDEEELLARDVRAGTSGTPLPLSASKKPLVWKAIRFNAAKAW